MGSDFVSFVTGIAVGLFIGVFFMAFIRVMNDARDRETNE